MVQWYVQRFPIDRLRIRFPTIMVTHVFLLFLILLSLLSFSWVVTNSQCMLEYVMWRVGVKIKNKKGFTGQKKATSISCVVDTRLENSGSQFISRACC